MDIERINKRLKIISDLQDEINNLKATYDESLENDPVFQEIQEEETKIKEEMKEKRVKVKSNSVLLKMEEELKNLKKEVKENREILSQDLADYYKESGSLEIVDSDGNQKRILFSARLINQ